MSARSKARRRALDLLFEADVRDADPRAAYAFYRDRRVANGQQPMNEYVEQVVTGVVEHVGELDARIDQAATNWTVDRMPGVDRTALRIAAWEILFRDDIPNEVAIDEAVQAARELSTDESPAFVNGVLAAIASQPRPAEPDTAEHGDAERGGADGGDGEPGGWESDEGDLAAPGLADAEGDFGNSELEPDTDQSGDFERGGADRGDGEPGGWEPSNG